MSPTVVLSIALLSIPPASPETLIRLNLQPMAAPTPALRYLLLPELKEMTPGNPIAAYLECFLDQDFTAENEVLRASALRQADRAARMDKPDWQILLKAKSDGIGLLIPDVGKLRALANKLQERFRAEVAAGHFDDAIVTAKTMFALSRHLSDHPTLIGHLVGTAIAQLTLTSVQEMLEQPGCPNLYWALTNLPDPFTSVAKAMEGEKLLLQGVILNIVDDTKPMKADQLRKQLEHLIRGRDFENNPSKEKTQAWLDERIENPVWLVNARSRLVDSGIPEERLLKFPIEQIILLDEKRRFEVQRDEGMKLMNLPTWQFEEMAKQFKPEKDKPLLGDLLPAVQKIRRAQGRLEQRMALLRHVEAIRLDAANHQGRLPKKLSDIAVPLPVDPFTGKPFRYSLEGGTAHLRGSPPPGNENVAVYNLHYEITIRQQ